MLTQRALGTLTARLRPGRRVAVTVVTAVPATPPLATKATLPTYALGDAYTSRDGLLITVLDMRTARTPDRPVFASLVVRARIENPTAAPVEFDNMLGVLDRSGDAYPRRYTDPARYPAALPGVATLAPKAVLEGDVYIDATAGTAGSFQPVYLMAVQRGCGGCPTGPVFDLVPLVRWQAVTV
jgi:hypothetical protein